MECYTLNQRTLFLLTAIGAVSLVLSFAGGYYSGLLNAPEPAPPKALAEELITAFLEAPVRSAESPPGSPSEEAPAGVDEIGPRLFSIPAPRHEQPPLQASVPEVVRPDVDGESTASPTQEPPAPTPAPALVTAETAAAAAAAPPSPSPALDTGNPDAPSSTEQETTSPPTETHPAESSPIVGYSVQVGSFGEQGNADESVERWRKAGYPAFVYHTTSSSGRRWHTVRIGRFESREKAAEMAQLLRSEKGAQAVTVPLVRR